MSADHVWFGPIRAKVALHQIGSDPDAGQPDRWTYPGLRDTGVAC